MAYSFLTSLLVVATGVAGATVDSGVEISADAGSARLNILGKETVESREVESGGDVREV
jgi:hypothetical protein